MAVVLHFFVFLAVFATSLASDVSGNRPLFCAKSVTILKGWSSTASNATNSMGEEIATLHVTDSEHLNNTIVKGRVISATSSTFIEALSKELLKAVKEGDVTRIEQLVEYGANLEYRDPNKDNFTVLHHSIASEEGCNTQVLEKLIDLGAPLEAKDKDGYTPLLIAAFLCREKCIEVLLSWTANVNASNEEGSTPLHLAVQCNSVPSVQLLLISNAYLLAQDIKEHIPHYYAQNKEMRDLLENHSSN